MAQYNLPWSAGGGLTTYARWNLLDLAPGLEEGTDVFCQVLAATDSSLFF